MSEIDLFKNLRLEQQLKEQESIPQFKWSLAGRGLYKTAKEDFFNKYAQTYTTNEQGDKVFKSMGEHIKGLLKDAPTNEAGRYKRDSKEIQEVKSYLREFHSDFYSISDEFSKHIEKDSGWKVRVADLYKLYNSAMFDMYDDGGLTKEEVQLISEGNIVGAEAINSKDVSEIQIRYNKVKDADKAYRDVLNNIGTPDADQTLTQDSIDMLKKEFDIAHQNYYEYSGIPYDIDKFRTEEEINSFNFDLNENNESLNEDDNNLDIANEEPNKQYNLAMPGEEPKMGTKEEYDIVQKFRKTAQDAIAKKNPKLKQLDYKQVKDNEEFKRLLYKIPPMEMSKTFGIKSSSGIKAAQKVAKDWNELPTHKKQQFGSFEDYLKNRYSKYYK